MAKSKSTTTTTTSPTRASSSRTKDRDVIDRRRSTRSNTGTRSSPVQSSPSKRRADDVADGSCSSKRRAVTDTAAPSSASQKACPIRPASSKGKGKEVALSELELFKQRHSSLFPAVVVKVEEPESDADNICVRAPPAIDSDDRQKLLDFVLIEDFGSKARRRAVDQLFRAARQSAASETDFCLTYVEATVSRLRRKGIKEKRLIEVVPMLREGIMEQCRARLDSLGGPLSPSISVPPPPGIRQVTAFTTADVGPNGANNILESRASQEVPAVVSCKGKQRCARSESVHAPSESSDSSSDDEATVVPGSLKNSKYRDDDDEGYVESRSRAARRCANVEYNDFPTSGSANNFILYGTRRSNGKMCDTYVRSVITACVPKLNDDRIGMAIRDQALLVWRIVSGDDKKLWKALHETRHSDPHIYKNGRRLLETQGYLDILKPKCRRLIRNVSAGQSRPAPALPGPTKTATVSSGDNTNTQSTSDLSDSSPKPVSSENTTAARPEIRYADDAQSISNRSCSSPEPTLTKHTLSERTPVAQPRCKVSAVAPPDPPESRQDFELPKHKTVPSPSLKDSTSSTHNAPDQSPSSSFPSSSEPTLPVSSSVVHSRSKDETNDQGQSSSPLAPAIFEHVPIAQPVPKNIFKSKSNVALIVHLHFRADLSEIIRIRALFPCLSRATSTTPTRKACYVPFFPRPEKVPGCLFIVNTPDVRTKRHLTKHDLQLACSASGLPQLQRANKNLLTVSFPNHSAAASALRALSIPLPSITGGPLNVKATYHGPFPLRTFSCDAKDLPNIDHGTVGDRVLEALRESGTEVRAPFEVLRQQSPGPQSYGRRYLIKFDWGNRPPCTPWVQCLYIPLDHLSRNVDLTVCAVFKPEDVLKPCSYCGQQCQRSRANRCPFTEVIGKR